MENILSIISFFTANHESDNSTIILTIIGIISCIVFIGLLVILTFVSKKLKTKQLTIISISIAMSFVLSFLKINIGLFGGSVTLFSMVPIILVSYFLGPIVGVFTGIIYGFLQFISEPYVFTYLTFFLDYIFAFSSIALACVFKKFKSKTLSISLGTTLVFLTRLLFHVLSGIMYFEAGWVAEGIPADSAFIYSLLYNGAYIIPDLLLALVFVIPFSRTKPFTLLENTCKIK